MQTLTDLYVLASGSSFSGSSFGLWKKERLFRKQHHERADLPMDHYKLYCGVVINDYFVNEWMYMEVEVNILTI